MTRKLIIIDYELNKELLVERKIFPLGIKKNIRKTRF